MKVDTNAGGQNVNQVIDLEVDQKAKTLVSKNEYGKAEITYQVTEDFAYKVEHYF